MTHPGNTAASRHKHSLSVPPDHGLDDRSLRARTESMAVRAFGTNLYEITTDSGSYLVDPTAGRCTCPDHRFRGARCKHLRRVAIEINEGRAPPPGQVAVACRDCHREIFVDNDRADAGPQYCPRHRIGPGDGARDRETGRRVVVVTPARGRADEVMIPGSEEPVAEYPTNDGYDPDQPVVGAVYPEGRVTEAGVQPSSLRVYAFPRSRLRKLDRPVEVSQESSARSSSRTREE